MWKSSYKEKFYDLSSSPHFIGVMKSKRMRWVGRVACMGERRGANSGLVERRLGIRPPVRPRHKWLDNIKMNLKKKLVSVWLRTGTGCGLLCMRL
jgi:hypothetical protein